MVEVAATTAKVVVRVAVIGKTRMASHLGICCFGKVGGTIIGTTVVHDLADEIAVAVVVAEAVIEGMIDTAHALIEGVIRAADRQMIAGGATIHAAGVMIVMIVVRGRTPVIGETTPHAATAQGRKPHAAGKRVVVGKRVGVGKGAGVALIALARHLQILAARANRRLLVRVFPQQPKASSVS